VEGERALREQSLGGCSSLVKGRHELGQEHTTQDLD